MTVKGPRVGRSSRARAALGAVTVLAVALSALFGGRTYLFCRAMNRVMSEPACCCAHAERSQPGQPAVDARKSCVELRVAPALLSFTIASDVAVPAAGILGVLPAVRLEPAGSAAVRDDGGRAIRAGPFSPAASRAKMMVFLT